MSANDICQCCEKHVHPVEERNNWNKFWHKIHINPADIPHITINQLRDSESNNIDPRVTYDLLFDRFVSIDSGYGRANQPNLSSDDDSPQMKTVMEKQDIDHIGYRLPGNKSFRAICDYTAQDADEVSFSKGDLIINCRSIDKDWMTGVVQRTGMCGMLPANSVQSLKVNL